MIGVFVTSIRVVYGRMIFMSLSQVNIMRQTIGPKSGHSKCRKHKNERPSPIGNK